MTKVKICGLSNKETLSTCIDKGVDMVGFVFFERSPRNVNVEQAAKLSAIVPSSVERVGLFVKQTPEEISFIAREASLSILQLHGTYSPSDITDIKARTNLPVLWAHGIAEAADFDGIEAAMDASDMLLFDAKPPKGSSRPGGNAIAFDWRLLKNRDFPNPWMLAGGLNHCNVKEAIDRTGAKMVDVSSGVESEPGQKDPELIKAFLKAAKS